MIDHQLPLLLLIAGADAFPRCAPPILRPHGASISSRAVHAPWKDARSFRCRRDRFRSTSSAAAEPEQLPADPLPADPPIDAALAETTLAETLAHELRELAATNFTEFDLPSSTRRLHALPVFNETEASAAFDEIEAASSPSPRIETPSFRDCISFALPALGIYACPPLMSLIDTSFVGRLSTSTELAALGPASSISDSAPLPLLFLSIASTNLIAKAWSQDDKESVSRVSRTALGVGAVCGTVLATVLYGLARPISALYCGGNVMNAGSATLMTAPCATYVSIRALALPFVVLSTIAQAISIGTKDTKTPMVSVAVAGALNLLGDFVLMRWFQLGIAGAAWATSASQVLSAGLLLRVLKRRGFLDKRHMTLRSLKIESHIRTMRQLLSFIPFLFVMAVKIGWHNSCTATAASLGGAAAAAHTALVSVAMVCFLLGDVGSSLAQAFLPAFLASPSDQKSAKPGEDAEFDMDAAAPTLRQLMRCTLTISAAAVTIASIAVGALGGQITGDPAVLAEMRRTLPWIAAALGFHGSAVTLEGLLLVRRKFRALSICYSALAATVLMFQVATRRWGLGLAGVWGCYVWFCASRVVAFSAIGGLLRPRRWLRRRGEGTPAQSPG